MLFPPALPLQWLRAPLILWLRVSSFSAGGSLGGLSPQESSNFLFNAASVEGLTQCPEKRVQENPQESQVKQCRLGGSWLVRGHPSSWGGGWHPESQWLEAMFPGVQGLGSCQWHAEPQVLQQQRPVTGACRGRMGQVQPACSGPFFSRETSRMSSLCLV